MGIFRKKSSDDKNAAPNPYAPMTDAQAAYAQYKQAPPGGLPSGPRGLPGGPAPRAPVNRNASPANDPAPPPYENGPKGYSNDRKANGYGNNTYGARSGGYGGLSNPDDDGGARDALFGGARERLEHKPTAGGYAASPSTAGAEDSGYGYGQRRELTEEEQEEEEVQDIRNKIKETKLASATSAENSERVAASAVETALGTYARLGAQGERLNYTNGLLDKASLSTREADGSTKKLKSLNRSMFAVHVDNPFTKGKRERKFEEATLAQHHADRDLREATRKAGWQANAQMEAGFKEIEATRSTNKWQRASDAEKKKFQFEDDSEDDEAEDRIDDAMSRTANHVSTLNSVAKMMGREIESQNTLIDDLGGKSDSINDAAKLNTERLRRIR